MENTDEQKIIQKKQLDNVRDLIELEISNLNSDILNLTNIAKNSENINNDYDEKITNSNLLSDRNRLKKFIRDNISNIITQKLTQYLNENLSIIIEPQIREYLGSKNEMGKKQIITNSQKANLKSSNKKNEKKKPNKNIKISLFKRQTRNKNNGIEKNLEKYDLIKLNKMTKIELEKLGRKHGVELDRRRKKQFLTEQLLAFLNSKDS